MDKKQSDILIFLDYWDNDNPTSDAQMGFMFAQMDNEEESEDIGEVYSNNFFYQKNPKEAIKEEIAKHRPRCCRLFILSFYDLLLHQFNPKMCGFYSN